MSRRTPTRTADAITERVRACAQLRAAWMERLWSEGQTSADQGLAIPPGEVRRILTDPKAEAERYRTFLREPEPERLAKAAAAADRALKANPFWISVAGVFGLSEREMDLLALCTAVDLNPKLGRVLAYLADDTRATLPTADAAATLFGWKNGLPAEMTGLLRWRLAHPVNGDPASKASTAWQADEAAVLSIKAERWVEPSLGRAARFVEWETIKDLPHLYPETLAQMIAELGPRILDGSGGDIDAAITGPVGSGRETLAAQFAAKTGSRLLSVRAPLLKNTSASASDGRADGRNDGLIRAARLARATASVLYWRDDENPTAQEWTELKLLGCRSLRGVERACAESTHRYALPQLTLAQRMEIWAHLSQEAPPSIVRTQRLTPAEIAVAAAHAAEGTIHASLRRAVQVHGDLMQALPCPYEWDDLVVNPGLHRLLKDFEAQVLLRWEVYEQWGFSRLTHLGQGISALFGGPSGTGKTMAAQVLARSLGLQLYRVDLAGVVNKYIGETEKRLRDVFNVCERSGALLFFDEADALFGNRMQVKDSHDRFANIEIDYLLQRIEQFDGIAILATNRKNDLDNAFLRRLRFVMDFLNPDKRERRILWEKSLPAFAPDGEAIRGQVDFELLANEMELTGAQIKAIVLSAAFMARNEGTRINMQHIELAAHREYAKEGKLLRAPLGRAAAL